MPEPVSPRSLRIGVTIGLFREDESLFTNGIKQNALYLAMTLQGSPHGHKVCLVNTTAVPITRALPWDLDLFPTRTFEEAKDDLDVLIELGGQVGPDQTDYLKSRGCRLISYCCGPEYVQNIEAMIFRRPLWSEIFINPLYDALWLIPQVAETSRGFLETLRRRESRTVPFVWHPLGLETKSRDLPDAGEFRPQPGPKRLAVFEPNIDVLKFCLYPTFIAELAYRQAPDEIAYLHVLNTEALAKENPEFIGVMSRLDIVRGRKASFVGFHETPTFLKQHVDLVVSHQWGLPLNYLYLEVCWQGYGLVHNASLCPELGYFYPGNDVNEGARTLLTSLRSHDGEHTAYRERQRRLIGRFLATNPAVSAHYDALLFELLAQPIISWA